MARELTWVSEEVTHIFKHAMFGGPFANVRAGFVRTWSSYLEAHARHMLQLGAPGKPDVGGGLKEHNTVGVGDLRQQVGVGDLRQQVGVGDLRQQVGVGDLRQQVAVGDFRRQNANAKRVDAMRLLFRARESRIPFEERIYCFYLPLLMAITTHMNTCYRMVGELVDSLGEARGSKRRERMEGVLCGRREFVYLEIHRILQEWSRSVSTNDFAGGQFPNIVDLVCHQGQLSR